MSAAVNVGLDEPQLEMRLDPSGTASAPITATTVVMLVSCAWPMTHESCMAAGCPLRHGLAP